MTKASNAFYNKWAGNPISYHLRVAWYFSAKYPILLKLYSFNTWIIFADEFGGYCYIHIRNTFLNQAQFVLVKRRGTSVGGGGVNSNVGITC